MKESYLYKTLKGKKVQCQTCSHFCVLEPGEIGKCGVRKNEKGKLFVLNYDKVRDIAVDPIEKKPLYHFFPGSKTLSVATEGCNFSCGNCLNWRSSQGPKIDKEIKGRNISPERIVSFALEENCSSIAYTYTEPTIFLELALDTMKLAKKEGLANIWVTNGFMSEEALTNISPFLDAVNVDLKSFEDEFYQKVCGGRLKPVLSNLKKMKEEDIWLEVTTLIIPTLSDDPGTLKSLALFIKKELGEDVPWHIIGFSAGISWKMKDLPDASFKDLKRAYKIGKEVGLDFVYAGNFPGLDLESTFCPECGEVIIKRKGFQVEKKIEGRKCPKCNKEINLILK